LPTLGYSLELLDDDDNWNEVFSGETNPDALSAIVNGLETGK